MITATDLQREAATLSAITGAERLWLGLNAAGHIARFFWRAEPAAADYPELRIVPFPPVVTAAGLPAGWKAVPIEPTPEMLTTFAKYDVFDCVRKHTDAIKMIAESMWGAVLAAAPAAPTAAAVAESQSQGDELPAPDWQPLTKAGQVKVGDRLKFTIGDKAFHERAKLILHAGTDKEEVIYDKGRNFYFITSCVLSGFSNHKNLQVLAAERRQKEQ